MGNELETLHFHVFGCEAYMFIFNEVCTNKLALLIIFIGYEDNSCFIHYTQENIIFCFTHAIFDKKLFSKYTNSHAKECKLYNKVIGQNKSRVLYTKFTHPEQYIPAVHSLSAANPNKAHLTHNMHHDGDAIIWVFYFP